MILFLKTNIGIWYKGGLFSLILCKQLVHMYDVKLHLIWIWKNIVSNIDNWFEKNNCFKK